MVQNCLGSYRLLKVIHTGQISQLWQAYDDGRQRMIAIKAILPKAAKGQRTGRLFASGVQSRAGNQASADRSRFTISTLTAGTPFLAMEWFPAPNLKKRIRTKEDREKTLSVYPHHCGAGGGGTGMDARQGLGPSRYQAREFPGK